MHIPSYIYAIRNMVTKRIYIGRTAKVKERFSHHMAALFYHNHTNELMQKDCDDFGLDSFTFSVIDEIDCYEDRVKEHEWMRRFNSTDPNVGYNYKENIINKDMWTEPDWVKELKTRTGTCPERSSKQRGNKERHYEN